MCIGATFAMTEIKIVLAMIVQRYRLALMPGARIDRKATLTLAPRQGMPARVARQDRRFTCVAIRGNITEMIDLHPNT
jgi:cytochrome P450